MDQIVPQEADQIPKTLRTLIPFVTASIVLSIIAVFSDSLLNWDEGYYLSTAKGFIENGSLYVKMWSLPEDTTLINGGGQGYGFLLNLILYKIFGLDLLVGRVLSLLSALLCIVVTYFYVKKIFGIPSALFAAAFFATSILYLQLISARFDATSLLVGIVLLWCWETLKKSTRYLDHILFGATSILALEFHLQNSTFIFAIWCGYFYIFLSARDQHKKRALLCFLSFSVGALLSSLLYLYIHLPGQFNTLMSISQNCALCDLKFFEKEVVRIGALFNRYLVEILFILFTVVFYIYKSITAEEESPNSVFYFRKRIVLFAFGYLFFIAIFPPHREFYIWPLLAPIVGYVLNQIFYHNKSKILQSVTLGFLLIIWLRTSALALNKIVPDSETREDLRISECIKQKLNNDQIIFAPGPKFIHLSQFDNFYELGRGIKYALPLIDQYKELSEDKGTLSYIKDLNPDLIWVDQTDWPESVITAQRYLKFKGKDYTKCCGDGVYCKMGRDSVLKR